MDFKQNASEIRRLFQERKEASQALFRFLISKGIAPQIAEDLLIKGREMGSIQDAMAAKIPVTGELPFTHPHKLALVGPTGVGKTTTLLKLASHYVKHNKRVALLSIDHAKKDQLKAWAEERQIEYVENLSKEIDLLLIDTEGCNYYLPNRIEYLGEQLAELGDEIEVILTLSAAAKEVDLYGAVHQFSALCPTSLVFTKLDETLSSGVLINVADKTDLPIRYVAFGFPLPGEVHLADSKTITQKILLDFNNDTFQILRQLTLSKLN